MRVNNNENMYAVVLMLCNNVIFSLLFTLPVIHYRYYERWGFHNAQYILCMDLYHEGLKMTL